MTRADIIPAARDEDTKLIKLLTGRLADVTADRDALLRAMSDIGDVLRVRESADLEAIVARVRELAAERAADA